MILSANGVFVFVPKNNFMFLKIIENKSVEMGNSLEIIEP